MNRNWLVSKTNPDFLKYLSREVSISPVLAQILINRDMKDAESVKDFLSPSIGKMHDPFLLPDMDKAVERLKKSIEKSETLLVHGDYDADGLTSTAILVSAFRMLGLKTFYHIPNRLIEGYGLSIKGIEKAAQCNADLIITADCGISSKESVSKAISMGMDVIVTDHHEVPDILPDALAVIDPHRKDSEYPFKHLAGVGVAFKLIQALYTELKVEDRDSKLESFLDLVALGTIADSVPLTGENRIIVSHGLKVINEGGARIAIKAMKEVAGVDREFLAKTLSFTLIPRINAAGRLNDASEVVELFLTDDIKEAKRIAVLLDEQNRKRKAIEGDVFKEAMEMIDPDNLDSAIVLSSPDWHAGVIGIVASRLVEMFYRPVFLFSIDGDTAKGSARSIPPFHLFKAISECSDVLIGYGGHRMAAGARISTDKLPVFKEMLSAKVDNYLSPDDLLPVLDIEAAVNLSEINLSLVKELSLLEPFGNSNKEPLFGARGINIVDNRIVGNNHLKMKLSQMNHQMDTIGFGMGDELKHIGSSSTLDIAFVPEINEWNGMRSIQLNLKALRSGE
jgi:single-stranded-DNA-specific exonuclease